MTATKQQQERRRIVRAIERGLIEIAIEQEINDRIEQLEEAKLIERLAASANWRA